MVGITNAGATRAIAFINCTYPAGSLCTASIEGITLVATGSSGTYTFKLPKAGTWTLTITDETREVNTDITVRPWTATDVDLDYTAIPEDLRSTYYEVEYISFLGSTDTIHTVVVTDITTTSGSTSDYYDIDMDLTPLASEGSDVYRQVISETVFGSLYKIRGLYGSEGKWVLNDDTIYHTAGTGSAYTVGEKYRISLHLVPSGGAFTALTLDVDGERDVTLTPSNTLFGQPFTFGNDVPNYKLGTLKGNYYRTKIKKNGTLVGDFVPCVRRSDSVCGFLNRITRTFCQNYDHNNQNSHSATPGPAI